MIDPDRPQRHHLPLLPSIHASEDGFDPMHEFPGAEGLRDVVVRSQFEPDEAIHSLVFTRQHDDLDVQLNISDIDNDQEADNFGFATLIEGKRIENGSVHEMTQRRFKTLQQSLMQKISVMGLVDKQ